MHQTYAAKKEHNERSAYRPSVVQLYKICLINHRQCSAALMAAAAYNNTHCTVEYCCPLCVGLTNNTGSASYTKLVVALCVCMRHM
jgi:hypothetical protein